MRSEKEMLDLILETARNDKRIRAVVMNGSRANPNAPRDPFQDFDVVYFVRDIQPFRCNLEWIKRFGELMILQMPEEMQDPPPALDGNFGYLMQFMDGTRIDLGICPLSFIGEVVKDSQSIVLLDKDGCIGSLPPASDRDYLPQPPTEKAFSDCCNEFWWVSPYVAKGLWRREITYAKYFLDHHVRDQLTKMVDWYVGVKTGFSCSTGKYGKYLQKYLEPEVWGMLLTTYSDASYENNWRALMATTDLFRKLARQVADHYNYDYPYGDDERVSAHLRHVRTLPRAAQVIY